MRTLRRAFLRLLRAGDRGAASLEILDRLGVLARFVPEWSDVRCRPQRDPYHRFTVDVHLTSSLRAMARSLAGDGSADDPVQAEAVKQVSDPDALLLGALLHDIGKNGEGGHVPVGARVVGVDPRSDGCRHAAPRSRPLHGLPAPLAPRHGHAPRPLR